MSSSSDRNSNLFNISSESSSSLSHHHNHHLYSAFTHKVKNLLEYQEDDLEQLYRKVEVIVKRYFEEHNIVEFREMYEHIACLKSNSLKMNAILAQLENKLLPQEFRSQQSKKGIEHGQGELSTSSTQHLHNRIERHRTIQASQQDVNSSIKYRYVFQPSLLSTHSKHKHKKERRKKVEASFDSPSKLNSSSESDYISRNRKYNQQIEQLEKQLKGIKQGSNREEYSDSANKTTIPSLSIPQLRENEDRGSRLSQETLIDLCNETNLKKGKAKVIKMESRDEVRDSSKATISQEQVTNFEPLFKEALNPSQQRKQKGNEDILRSNKGFEAAETHAKSSTKIRSSKHNDLVQHTEKITKQIQELKEMASRLSTPQIKQTDPSNIGSQKNHQSPSSTSIAPADTAAQMAGKQESRKFLEQIQNTTSKQEVTEHMLTSFKPAMQDQQLSHPPDLLRVDQVPPQSQTLYLPFGNNSSQLTNSYYIGSRQVLPQPQIGVVRYSYNPFSNQSITIPQPDRHIRQAPYNRSVSLGHSYPSPQIPVNHSTLMSNSSTTSIMQHPRPVTNLKKTPLTQSLYPPQPFQPMVRPSRHYNNLSIAPPDQSFRRKGITLTTETS